MIKISSYLQIWFKKNKWLLIRQIYSGSRRALIIIIRYFLTTKKGGRVSITVISKSWLVCMGAELDVLLKNIRTCYTKKRRGDQKRFKCRNKIKKWYFFLPYIVMIGKFHVLQDREKGDGVIQRCDFSNSSERYYCTSKIKSWSK